MNAKTVKLISKVHAMITASFKPEQKRSFKKEMKREWYGLTPKQRAKKRRMYKRAVERQT